MADPDRTVHAADRYVEVVRYNRRGHWYLEDTHTGKRERVTVKAAARRASVCPKYGGRVHLGRPGGGAFDREVRKLDDQ